MRIPVLLALFFAVVAAVPSNPQRIVGGSVTTINQYPSLAAVLRSYIVGIFWRECGGTILNSRSILTAAECTAFVRLVDLRIRVGSTWGDTGGVVHNVNGNIIHPSYDRRFPDYDIAILRSATTISFDNNVRVASIAGANYNLAENQAVWFAGWDSNSTPEQLRHVQLTVINQGLCRIVHAQYGLNITDGMLCAGWANGGRGQCDKGGPLFHNGVVVGVSSYGGCGWNNLYSANTRVSPYTTWIQSNA